MIEIEEHRPAGGGAAVDVDATELATGPLIAALGEDGSVRIEAISQRRNLLTDEVITEATGSTLEPEIDGSSTIRRFALCGFLNWAIRSF